MLSIESLSIESAKSLLRGKEKEVPFARSLSAVRKTSVCVHRHTRWFR